LQKKKQKNSYLLGVVAPPLPTPAGAKVFWFFFSKKNRFLSTLRKGCEFQAGPVVTVRYGDET
jgi:hypothetical protein